MTCNCLDSYRAIRSWIAMSDHRAKAEDVRFLYFTRRLKQREIAEIHGIKQNTVSRIVSGMVWV